MKPKNDFWLIEEIFRAGSDLREAKQDFCIAIDLCNSSRRNMFQISIIETGTGRCKDRNKSEKRVHERPRSADQGANRG